MTELQYLIELLLNHKLQKNTKDSIQARIKEVEEALRTQPPIKPTPVHRPPTASVQSPSTQAILDRNPDIGSIPVETSPQPSEPAVIHPTPAVVASAAAAQTIASRQTALAAATSGKPEKGRTSPRKW